MSVYQRKLVALGYARADVFDPASDDELFRLIVWLEDMRIRHYKVEERAGLRDASDSAAWASAFNQYLKDLGAPIAAEDTSSIPAARGTLTDWLLGYAIRLEYSDNAEKYTHVAQQGKETGEPLPIDFHGDGFKAGLASILSQLNLPKHPDPLLLLQAVATFVGHRLTQDAIAAARASADEEEARLRGTKERMQNTQVATASLNLHEQPLGFTTGDRTLDDAAKILRLLHIAELRDLQTRINEVIVSVQSLTANPKTDSKLGKTGR